MFPFTYSPTYEYPLSGDVVQDIETSWFARMKGVPEVEYEIITEVWSYGEQLGCLTDVLLEVVDEMGLESPAVTKLRAKAEEMAGCYEAAMTGCGRGWRRRRRI
jgi:hypothetical protein